MIFRTYNQIAADVREWSRRLPRDVAAVAGVPRSGSIVAALLAEFRHCHLAELRDLIDGRSPWTVRHRRRIPPRPENGRVLLIDDTCWSGRTMEDMRRRLAHRKNVDYCALYYGRKGLPFLDRAGRFLPSLQHSFQHNMLRDCLIRRFLFDLDGVICEDWGRPDVGKHAEAYQKHLQHARPLYLPSYPIPAVVTARLERWRPETANWLAKHGVRCGRLEMAPFETERERERYGHARYKSDVYARSQARLFVESDDRQAREIHQRTKRPVLCVDSLTCYGGQEPGDWHSSPV